MHENKGNLEYKVLRVIRGTTVDGPGFRTSIYLSGCAHKCAGCHNPGSWDPEEGETMSINDLMKIVLEEEFSVTLSGGDPLFHPESTRLLIDSCTANGISVWVYTGYTWEQILASPLLLDSVRKAEVVVDGPFIESLRDPDLLFRGSSNQRLIDVKRSIEENEVCLYTARFV